MNDQDLISTAISIKSLRKIYSNGFVALDNIDLDIQPGEIFALLGPNGAGKTTLISAVCGLLRLSSGTIQVHGQDIIQNDRAARALVGLVPQELTIEPFSTVWNTVCFSRGLFGKPADPDFIERLLKRFLLWDKRNNQLRTLSGGMKRRVMIAKALSHEPSVLFLDEPSAGVDVELRKSMWEEVKALRRDGVTVILTTHYIEEAEEIADRIGVIQAGKLIVVEEKEILMRKMGKKQLIVDLCAPLDRLPSILEGKGLALSADGNQLHLFYDPSQEYHRMSALLEEITVNGIAYKDLSTRQSSLEEIFVELVNKS